MERRDDNYDVVILGGGMAGLTLARHLLLHTDKTVLLLERRDFLPPERQKVGESTVQLGGYYLSKVLDLEEHLFTEHLMKYNLRFNWPTPGTDGRNYEDYGQAGIRTFSNIPSFQVDRNLFEAEVLRQNLESPRFRLQLSVDRIRPKIMEKGNGPHRVTFEAPGSSDDENTEHLIHADWVIDATGRVRLMARQQGLKRKEEVGHGSFFWWVEGLVDVEKLTDRSSTDLRTSRARGPKGHSPSWLATNHFCAEGVWLWVIPLRGKTSLGLVFDKSVVDRKDVFSVEKATRWVCKHFPCLARDLPHRKVLDHGGFADYAYDCSQAVSSKRWAITGESGRFSDPLYSPGTDLIALHNTLIVDAVSTPTGAELDSKCHRYDQFLRAVFKAYLPSYTTSYDALGDPETLSLKYSWELTVYFAGYVFPFINDLFTERRFLLFFTRLFMRLGVLNHAVQQLLSDFYQWKKSMDLLGAAEPFYFDFTCIDPLKQAEGLFYEVGVSVNEARDLLAEQIDGLEELGRFIAAHAASVVLDDPRVARNRSFVEGFALESLRFDPETWASRWDACPRDGKPYPWSFDPEVMAPFRKHPRIKEEMAS